VSETPSNPQATTGSAAAGEEAPPQNLFVLKAVVVTLGILIVVCLIALVVGLILKGRSGDSAADSAPPPAAGAELSPGGAPIPGEPSATATNGAVTADDLVSPVEGWITPFDEKALPLPQGATLIDAKIQGRLLLLHGRRANAGDVVVFYDLVEHEVLGEFNRTAGTE